MAEFSFRHLKGSRRPLAFPHSLNAAITKSNSHLVNSISIFAPVSQKLLCELSAKISSLFYVLLYVASRPTSRYDIWRQEDVSAFVGTCTRNQRPNYSYHYHQNRKNYYYYHYALVKHHYQVTNHQSMDLNYSKRRNCLDKVTIHQPTRHHVSQMVVTTTFTVTDL